jgi:hypothetical protein
MHLREIKAQYDLALLEKNNFSTQYNTVLGENEQLTIIIAQLKSELTERESECENILQLK